MPDTGGTALELTLLMPCLNEAETIATCVRKARGWLERAQVKGEVLIADNGSTDGSIQLAEAEGARVVAVPTRGYGAALRAGIEAAHGRFIIMGDADDSYDFANLDPFVTPLRQGYDLVMGNRFAGGIAPGAMPKLHYFLGNPVLTFIGRLLFRSSCGDFHCGLRGFNRASILALGLQTQGMEFASEMVVRATLQGLRITEVPTTLKKDGRSRPPHLRSWRDGWRHLRFLLMYSPRWLFLVPGISLVLVGLLLQVWLVQGPQRISGVTFDIHTMLAGGCMMIVGLQSLQFALFTKVFAISQKLLPRDPRLEKLTAWATLETGLVLGGVLLVAGVIGVVALLRVWSVASFGNLEPPVSMRLLIPSVIACATGAQIMLGSFFLSILTVRRG